MKEEKKAGTNMKDYARLTGILLAVAAVFFLLPVKVYAEGLSVSADKESCDVGDKVVVSVDAEQLGGGDVPPDIQVEFDSRRLNFESCSAEYGGGGGGLVTFKDKKATVEFTTLSGGNADVKVTATADDAAGPESASVTVAVSGEDTAALAGDGEGTPTGLSEGSVDIGDGRVIQAVFADEFKPVLFHKETTAYNGQTVECAKFDMGDITLVYTTDTAGADGRFMILDSNGELSDFRMIQGIENRFIIVLSDCEGSIPEGYTKAVLDWNGQTLTAFMEESVAAGTAESADGIDRGDFFLVYAVSSEGNKGWYRYDKNEGTYQRFINESAGSQTGDENETKESETGVRGLLDDYIPANIQSILVVSLAPLALILLIAVIILAIKVRDYGDELDAIYDEVYYGGEEEEEEAKDEEEHVARRSGGVTAASLVGRSMSEEEDDEEEAEDDEEDEEEAEEDEEDVRDNEEEDEEDDEEDDEMYSRPLTRREKRELAREEKWRLKEEKKAAKLRAKGYEEATPMDWSSFEKEREDDVKIAPPRTGKLPKYMTESMKMENDEESDMMEEENKKPPLPPRKKTIKPEDIEMQRPAREEDARERQRRLFEQQQRIEEQRRIEKEMAEEETRNEQQKFIASKTDELDLDEDFQFEFLEL